MTPAPPTSPASAARPKWRVHLIALAVVGALGLRLAMVSSAEHWGRADWVSMDGLLPALLYVYLPAHVVASSLGVMREGTSTRRVLTIHALTPFFLGGLAMLLITVLASLINATSH